MEFWKILTLKYIKGNSIDITFNHFALLQACGQQVSSEMVVATHFSRAQTYLATWYFGIEEKLL